MLLRFLPLLAVVLACSAPDPGAPIDTINPVIGDRSFVVRYGRAPTDSDDPIDRVQTHLAYVEAQLRARDVSALPPDLQAMRARLLDALDDYQHARRFPRGESAAGRLPTFLDPDGARCAVAYLVEQTAGLAVVRALDERYHNAFVAQFDDRVFAAWVARSGFTRDELAMLQPTYGGNWMRGAPEYTVDVGTTYDYAVDGSALQVATVQTRVRDNIPHNEVLGDLNYGLDGGLGWASGDHLAYNLSARIGDEMLWFAGVLTGDCNPCDAHRTGVSTGITVDAIGSYVHRAWTIPLDAYWYLPGPRTRHLGLVGGVSWQFAGADRRLGWWAGLDLVKRNVFDGWGQFDPRDMHVGVAVKRLAGETFVGVSFGISNMGRYDVDGRDW